MLARPPRALLLAVAVAAAVGAALASAAPTGSDAVDLPMRAALGLALVAAGAVAPRAALVASTVLLTAALVWVGSPVTLLAGAALGTAVAAAVAGRHLALAGAATGGLVAQVVLRLEWPERLGATLAVGAVVSLAILLPSLWRLPGRARRPLGWAAAAVVAVLAVGVVGGAAAAVGSADDVDVAVASAERGLDLAGDDPAAARVELDRAAARFGAAERRLGAVWARPALLVPVLAQQVRAATTMTAAGADLAAVARDSVEEADVERIRPVQARVDLDALRALGAPLRRADEALATADVRLRGADSPWLVAPLADKLHELTARLDDAARSAELATMAVDVLPAMLGGDGPRHYLLLLQQPAEARGSGGLPGNFGEIVADDGRLELVRFGRHEELSGQGVPEDERQVDMPEEFDALYGYDQRLLRWQNVTFSPDFTDVAELARQLYPLSGGGPLDGVLSVDPTAIADLLGVLGPVELPGGRTLRAGNAEELLYFQQYVEFQSDDGRAGRLGRSERIDLLGDAAVHTWARIAGGDLPGPRALADAFGPAVAGRHLQVSVFDPGAQGLLERLGLTGALPEPSGDGVGFAVQNAGQNKIDWFVDRSSAYDVTWDPATGAASGTYRVTLTNAAPSAGLPSYIIGPNLPQEEAPDAVAGDSISLVHLYTALPPTAVRVGETPHSTAGTQRDGRWYVTPIGIEVPAGESATIELDVAGLLPDPASWHLDVVRQPAINGDDLAVTLTVADGWRLSDLSGLSTQASGASAVVALDQPVELAASAISSSSATRRAVP